MNNKYMVDFSMESIGKNIKRLINQTWKLIPMRETNEDWQKQLDTIIIEIVGFNEIFYNQPQLLQILSKLEGLRNNPVDFSLFRKTIFEVISLIQGLNYVLA